MSKKAWLIFDSRYLDDPDKAIVHLYCESLEEAQEEAPNYGDNNVIVEYDDVNDQLINPKIID